MKQKLLITLLIVLSVYIALNVVLFVFQRSLIYFPQARGNVLATGLVQHKKQDVSINISVQRRGQSTAVLYFGGNAEDVSFSVPDLAAAFPDATIYAMHYRGYGGSEGSPSESALIADALSLFDRVDSEHEHITVIGRSLGSGIAIQLASQRLVRNLVLITPYDSIQNIAAEQFPLFPVRWLLLDTFESWRYAKNIQVPTLVIAAEHDEVIPRASTEALLRHFRPSYLRYEVVKGVGHNSISSSDDYVALLREVSHR